MEEVVNAPDKVTVVRFEIRGMIFNFDPPLEVKSGEDLNAKIQERLKEMKVEL